MNYASKDPRRRGLMQDFSSFNLSADWDAPSFIRAKTIRSMALSGQQDLTLYGMEIKNPLGIIEILGSRTGTISTVLLAIFTPTTKIQKASFRCDGEYAVGRLDYPVSMFAGILQLVSSPNLYFRIGNGGACNRISTDPLFASA